MDLEPGLVIAGKYRVERLLAAGGMGSLWVARHLQLDAAVAIKFMDPASAESPVAQQRFEREARSAASLRSMHIVHVHDYGVADGMPYIVMELLTGEDLGRRLKRERRLSLLETSKILTQTAKGLRRAHEAGVVHRDLKPANIYLARNDAQEEDDIVKILDFGIAKEMLASPVGETTRAGEILGSPHYMSPEQTRGLKDIDQRSDLWSLGVILFRAVTGHLPFSGDAIGEVMAKIIADPIPRATQVGTAELPPSIDAFFDRAFARDRELRFQSAREMADAFSLIVQDVSPTWTGEHTQSPSTPRWSLTGIPNMPRSNHPGQDAERNGLHAGVASSPGRLTPFPGQASISTEIPPPPSTSQSGFHSSILTPIPSNSLISSDGSLTATGGSIEQPQGSPSRRSPTWIAAAAGILVVALGVAIFAMRRGPEPAADELAASSANELTPRPGASSPSGSGAAPQSDDAVVDPQGSTPSLSAPIPSASPSSSGSAAPSSGRTKPGAGGGGRGAPSYRPPPAASSKKKLPSWGF